MGAVWLAHRSDGRYEARVAIKLLNPALLGPGGIERFRREGTALGRLAHPNIARLIDAGVTQAGQPYLVLAAVTHAHAKLILHRDLKPSNILVTTDGKVKLLDFGIAKLLDDDAAETPGPGLTQLAGHAFTPDYAAPEQVQGGEVTSATDVYALGVLFYVQMTGRHPTVDQETAPLDRLRAIVDTVPVRPSDAGRSERDRGQKMLPSARMLRGDLDNIILKALKKSPAERYLTVEAFADDLRRYLAHQPVSVHADSLAYRASKFVVRNKLVVGAAAVVLLTVAAAAVVDFVTSMLTEVAPADQPVRVSDLLERSQSILIQEDSIPEHRAAILGMLSGYYLSSGKPAQAETLLARSLELTATTPDQELRAVLLCDNAYAASLLGRPDDARKLIEQGLDMSRADPMAAVTCLRDRAYIAQNTYDPAAALDYAQQAQVRLKEFPVAKPELEAQLLADIAAAHYLAGRNGVAERFYAEALAQMVKIGRGESPSVFFIRNNWGIASFAAGDTRRQHGGSHRWPGQPRQHLRHDG